MNDESLDVLVQLAQQTPVAFDAFIQWAGDGQNRGWDVNYVLHDYEFVAFIDEDTALRVLQMPFMEYVTVYDAVLLRNLGEFFALSRDHFDQLLLHPNFRDGIVDEQRLHVTRFLALGEEAPLVLGMPFMESLDELDHRVLQGLERVKSAKGEGYLRTTLARFSEDGGITDETAPIVAAAGMAASYNRHDLVDVIFDPERTHVETRVIETPLSEEIRLYVIRPGAVAAAVQRSRTMDLLEQALRSQEEFMQEAFPHRFAILLAAQVTRFGGTGGGGFITTGFPEHRGIIAHETAHSYWPGPVSWIAEGGASFLDVISHRAYDGTPLPTFELPCPLFDSIQELDRSGAKWEEVYESGCNYSLGRGLFRELYNSMGDEAFRLGFRNLHVAIRDRTYVAMCGQLSEVGNDVGVCYLHESFTKGASPEHVDIVNDVLARRYYGTSS